MPAAPRSSPRAKAAAGLQHFFSPCPRGLEEVLLAELEALGATRLERVDGGVAFAGPFDLCYRANLHSRIASRVLWRLARAPYRNEADLYEAAAALPWPDHFPPERTIRVNVSATASPLRSLDFVTLRIKDAVCDRFRVECGRRPSVDTANPDLRIHAFLDAASVSIYLDTSGEPLFKRGLRGTAAEAPLRENLAAGILRLAGWAPAMPLLDPMCGGGTLLLEAAEMALQRAPGSRRSFAFEKLDSFDADAWRQMRAQAQAAERPLEPLQSSAAISTVRR